MKPCKNHIRQFDSYFQRVRLISNIYDDHEDEHQLRLLEKEIRIIKAASTCAEVARFYGTIFQGGDCL